MSKENDPIGNSQEEQLAKSDLFIANMNLPEVTDLITPDDKAKATANNQAMHRDKLASDQADAAAQNATKVKNATFANAEKDQRAIRGRIMKTTGYTKAKGETLGIERSETVNATYASDGPTTDIKGKPGDNGGAELKAKKNGADAVDIYSQRDGETELLFLARVIRFPWTDKRPLLVPGKPEVRRYAAQLVIKGEPTGPKSAVISVTVTA